MLRGVGDSCVNRQAAAVAVAGPNITGVDRLFTRRQLPLRGRSEYRRSRVIDDDLTMPVPRIAAAGPEETE